MLSNSAGEFGTRRMIILRPSVEPTPIDANERIDAASENSLPEPPSLKTYDSERGNRNCKFVGGDAVADE